MAALTAARNTVMARTHYGDTLRIPMAADAVIFLGGLVNVDADGYAVPAADTADHKCAGVAIGDPQDPTATANDGKYNNYGGDDGDVEVVVRNTGRARFLLAERTPTQDMLFAMVYVYDDQNVAVHAWDVTNEVRCGHIVRLPGTTLAAHPETELAANEVEIEFSGTPFEWDGDVTTTTAAATTTAGA